LSIQFPHIKPTLGQVLVLSFLVLTATLALLFDFVFRETRAALMESSEHVREQASHEITERVTSFLAKAPDTASAFQQQINFGFVNPSDPAAVEAALFSLLVSKSDLGEITFTHAEQIGVNEEGAIQLAPAPRWQISVARSTDGKGVQHFWSRHVRQENGAFVAYRRTLEPRRDQSLREAAAETRTVVTDPTSHLTFTTPASKDFYGQLLWSDLHWSQLDSHQIAEHPAIEVSVQQTVENESGKFAGVIRVGLLAEQLDRAVQLKLTPAGMPDPHHIFLSDRDGRLITRGVASDRAQLSGEDLRIAPPDLAPEIAHALAQPALRGVDENVPVKSGHFKLEGQDFLTTFRVLPETQDWTVGIVVPREFYLGELAGMRMRLLAISLVVMLLLIAAGMLILRSVKHAQEQITRESLKMNAFEFSPASTSSAFRDVSQVLENLEKAKAAMRAMSKYAPVDLVRRLYREKRDPVLGGELMEISIMFSDIRGFTTFSEQLEPNRLADVLGLYLDALSHIIQRDTRGTIDKYIGDAIMAIWNAPEPVADHPRMACLAALRCREATYTVAKSPEWGGLPVFETRFGLHCANALVGHFGARDRMNYTAIGDAINLSSRLEGLNKQYGTSIIVSENVAERARDDFDFRLLDIVEVKGKTEPITIYELLGSKGCSEKSPQVVTAYEAAFSAYVAQDFKQALDILEEHLSDPPSAVLTARCKTFLQAPPPRDWRGIYISTSK
jgi:adenylate cyclase